MCDDKPSGDRPAEKLEGIEITPEMIEAGLAFLYRYHPEKGLNDEDTVAAIYREMYALRPRRCPVLGRMTFVRDG